MLLVLNTYSIPMSVAQSPVVRPKNSISWGGHYFKQAPLQASSTDGPNYFGGWWTPGYSFLIDYNRNISPEVVLSAGLAYSVIPFSFEWDLGGSNNVPDRTERWYIENYPLYTLRLGAGWMPFREGKFLPFIAPRVELLFVPSEEQSVNGYRTRPPYSDTAFYSRSLEIASQGSQYCAIALSVGVKYTFANDNSLSLFLDSRLSEVKGLAYGSYTITSGNTESSGLFSIRMQYIGIGLAYSTSWGEPKLPRYMRPER